MKLASLPLPLVSGLQPLTGEPVILREYDGVQTVQWGWVKLQFDSAVEHAYRSATKTRQIEAELKIPRIAEAWRADPRSHTTIRVIDNNEIGLDDEEVDY